MRFNHSPKNISWLLLGFLIFLAGVSNSFAQNKTIPVAVNCFDCRFKKFPDQFISKETLFTNLEKVKQSYISKGYLAFSIDSVVFDSLKANIYGTRGPQYYLKQWKCIPETYSHLLHELNTPRAFNDKLIKRTEEKLLTKIHSQGFADGIIKKEMKAESNNIIINYNLQLGKKYSFDTISILGDAKISENFIAHKTGIFANAPYESKKVEKINSILNQTGFLTVDTMELIFKDSKVKLLLTLNELQQNRFSGIVGIQTNKDNHTEITGDIELQLVNSFKEGERIYLGWKKPADKSQELKLDFQYPYLFKSSIGLLCSALLEKQDSSFSNTSISGGLSIPSYNSGEIAVLVQWKNSSTNQTSSTDYGTSSSHLYGLSYQYLTYNPYQMAKKGIGIYSKIFAGNKKIFKTGEDDYSSFFSELHETIEWLIPMPLGALYLKNQSGLLINDSLYRNNLLRVGGFNSMRGFNEKSIYTKAYSYFTSSYHIFLRSNSYLEGFYDIGWFNEPTNQKYNSITRQAIGMGINITTKAGQLSIAFAIGKKENEPFSINDGKIHLGYISLF